MSYIVRTYLCGNAECAAEFDSGDAAPGCPKCRNVNVSWVPRGGHVLSAATQHNDRTLKSLAGQFGLTNLRSARQGESAHPGVPQGKPLDGMRYGPHGGIPLATTCTAGFAPNPPNIRIVGPSDGKQRFKRKGPIPTTIKAVDPRPLKL